MARKFAAIRHPIPQEGVVQLDDRELATNLAEYILGKKRPFKLPEEELALFLGLAAVAIGYFEDQAEAAEVRYA